MIMYDFIFPIFNVWYALRILLNQSVAISLKSFLSCVLLRYQRRFGVEVEPLIEQMINQAKVEESEIKAQESQKQVRKISLPHCQEMGRKTNTAPLHVLHRPPTLRIALCGLRKAILNVSSGEIS